MTRNDIIKQFVAKIANSKSIEILDMVVNPKTYEISIYILSSFDRERFMRELSKFGSCDDSEISNKIYFKKGLL